MTRGRPVEITDGDRRRQSLERCSEPDRSPVGAVSSYRISTAAGPKLRAGASQKEPIQLVSVSDAAHRADQVVRHSGGRKTRGARFPGGCSCGSQEPAVDVARQAGGDGARTGAGRRRSGMASTGLRSCPTRPRAHRFGSTHTTAGSVDPVATSVRSAAYSVIRCWSSSLTSGRPCVLALTLWRGDAMATCRASMTAGPNRCGVQRIRR
jgi:hypothetical protein